MELADDRGALLLLGHVGSGSRELARCIARRSMRGAVLDPLTARTVEECAAQLVREFLPRYQPLEPERLDEPTRDAQRFREMVADLYDDDTGEAVEIDAGMQARGWTITRALGSPVVQPLIVVLDAHRLGGTPVLSELRDLVAHGRISLIVTSRPHQQDWVAGAEAPFFGAIQTVGMVQRDFGYWMRPLEGEATPADLESLFERARGRTATMLEVLAARRSKDSLRDAWLRAALARLPQAEAALVLGGAIHEFAPRLLLAIAAGQAPYASIVGARPNRIAKALGQLHGLDLIEQPQSRRWQIADPLLDEALRLTAEREHTWPTLGEQL